LVRKYARIFVRGYYLFQVANSFPRALLEENCELRGTDNREVKHNVYDRQQMAKITSHFAFISSNP